MNAREVLALVCAGAGLGVILGAAFLPAWLPWGWGLLVLALLAAKVPVPAYRRPQRRAARVRASRNGGQTDGNG